MHSFQLSDRSGAKHDYRVEPHPGGPGAVLALRVQSLATEPLVEVVHTLASAPGLQELASALKDGSDKDSGELLANAAGSLLGELGSLDLTAVSKALSAMLGAKDGLQLVKDILSRTYRDGKPLSEAMNFDAAYQANYWELQQAVIEVVRFNGFFPLADLLQSSVAASETATPTPRGARRSSTANGG